MGAAQALVYGNGNQAGSGWCSAVLPSHHCLNFDNEVHVREEFRRDAVIIFDWDDTLMCSTAIKERDVPHPAQLAMLERVVARLLMTAIGMGFTAIVTNASLPWVRTTAQTYMPSVVPLLERVVVTSARQSYEEAFPTDPCAWKIQAFRDVISNFAAGHAGRLQGQNAGTLNLTALGDSMVDIEAAEFAGNSCNSLVKTVKLTELPTVAELLGQLQVVQRDLPHLVEQGKSCSKTLVQGALTGWRISDRDGEAQPFTFF